MPTNSLAAAFLILFSVPLFFFTSSLIHFFTRSLPTVFRPLVPSPSSLVPAQRDSNHIGPQIPPFLVCNPMKPINLLFFFICMRKCFFHHSRSNLL
jgi:hypothetical protein